MPWWDLGFGAWDLSLRVARDGRVTPPGPIMPLANQRDKKTQAIWGIKDFEKRFGRFPEGMWLPETAVDLETLEVLAELGINAGLESTLGSQALTWSVRLHGLYPVASQTPQGS